MSSPEEFSEYWRSGEGDSLDGNRASKNENEQARDFDVFLCHNAADKPTVRWVADRLRERGILPWLDEDELRPGRSWQEELEKEIARIKTAAVFMGPNGLGPWQNREMRAFLNEFTERQAPIIPVFLSCADTSALPVFLRGLTWVDLSTRDTAQIDRLVWGINGRRPRKSQ